MKWQGIGHLGDRKKKICHQLLCTGLMFISSPAFAGAGDSALEVALYAVIDWFTGGLGLAAGTLAIVGAGAAGLSGRMPIAYLKSIGISLGVMYSAAFIAELITGG